MKEEREFLTGQNESTKEIVFICLVFCGFGNGVRNELSVSFCVLLLFGKNLLSFPRTREIFYSNRLKELTTM